MNRSLVISLFLFATCNLSLLAGARALEGDAVYSEAGRPLSLDEEEILARIIQEEAQARFDDAPNSASDDNVEIELEPPANAGEKETAAAEQTSKNDPPATPIKKGQSEFVTFVEPEIPQSQRLVDTPELTVKRVPMESSLKQRGGVAGSVTEMGNVVFLTVVTVCAVAAVGGMVVGGVFWHKLHKQHLAAQEAEYPQYGVIGPSKEKKNKRQNGDESMAYKAQLHHYQQTKQKIISGEETGVTGGRHESDESGDEADDGDYSVYECPGLAPTGDIEVQNPMFDSNASTKHDTVADGD